MTLFHNQVDPIKNKEWVLKSNAGTRSTPATLKANSTSSIRRAYGTAIRATFFRNHYTMIEPTSKESYIVWQNDPQDGVAEPALLIEKYLDTVSITQKDNCINVNYESIDELCKLLKKIQKDNA